jgi:Carboxypeptidase regulatory-like domain
MDEPTRANDAPSDATYRPTRGRVSATTSTYVRLAVVIGVMALAGCAQKTGGTPTPSESGIKVTGTVTASPGCPGPQRIDSPCPDRPVAGAPVEFARDGAIVATTTTDAAGHFSITVAPGSYEVTARNVGYFSRITRTVDVTAPLDLSLVVDSGMR